MPCTGFERYPTFHEGIHKAICCSGEELTQVDEGISITEKHSDAVPDRAKEDTIAKWLRSRQWLCLICKKCTSTVPAMLGHLRIKHRRRAKDIGSGHLYGSMRLKRLAAFVGADTRATWQENVDREWD